MPKTLFIVCPKQFGYLTDYYYYCKYLGDFTIVYLCRDQGLKKIMPPSNTEVYYISESLFIIKVISFIRHFKVKHKGFTYLVYYHKFCLVYTLLLHNEFKIVDIRTGAILANKTMRMLCNFLIRIEALFYNRTFIISESLRKKLKINHPNPCIVPLGAIEIGYKKSTFDKLNLLYVGTFYNRKIHLTIKGLASFIAKHPDIKVSYTLIGFGPDPDVNLIMTEINKNGNLQRIVRLLGRLHHSELKEYFDKANIGVSFIPQTDYFQCQPPTKTFEYICSGLICIATATEENKRVIDRNNGVVINDTPEGFVQGLEIIWRNRNMYDSEMIRTESAKYHWSNIVEDHLKPALLSLG